MIPFYYQFYTKPILETYETGYIKLILHHVNNNEWNSRTKIMEVSYKAAPAYEIFQSTVHNIT